MSSQSDIASSIQSKRPPSPTGSDLSRASKRINNGSENNGADSNLLPFGSSESSQNRMDMGPSGMSSPVHYNFSSELSTQTGHYANDMSTFKRADIRSDSRNVRQINLNPASDAGNAASESELSQNSLQLVVWGTDVSINKCREQFKKFIKTYKLDNAELDIDEVQSSQDFTDFDVNYDSQERPYYIKKLKEILVLGNLYFDVNCHHIYKFNQTLYRQLVCYPQEVIPTFDMAINEIVNELYPSSIRENERVCVRPFNVMKTSNIRNLNPDDINQLITFSGMVTRTSSIIAEMCIAFFECTICGWSTTVEVDRGSISEPQVCRHCNTKFSFKLVHNRSKFTDKQQVKLQESPDDMPAGQTPYTVLLYACSNLVDQVQPGERVTVTGIYRATSIRVNPKIRNIKSVFRTHVDVVHYRKVENKRLHDTSHEIRLSKERIDKLIALSNLEDIYERLAHSIAPSIYEHEDIKKGILLQLFGGTRKDTNAKNVDTFRSEINILLCGDPGTSKSQLLQYVYNLVPRGQYTSGKGSSAVGLTAYITKDPDSKQIVLQTGALVLSDGGICCIDEFDKMSDSTRSVLHEVMEQQTLSIAKAGIICQLNARTSILAAANPVESQWNKNKTIMENIELPPTLMSRFDLIFLILDPQDEEYDRRLAKHLINLYHRSEDEEVNEHLDMSLLKDYIGYARTNFFPVLSPEAQENLKHSYVEMRRVGSSRGQISAYPRQLESLIRMAEAHAKMHFKNVVDLEDVEEAKRLMREAIKQSAIDPSTGKIDISILSEKMDPMIFLEFSNELTQMKMFPYFDTAHFIVTCLYLRDDLSTGHHAFSRKHPFACWISCMFAAFAGNILSGFLLGEPIMDAFKSTNHVILGTAVSDFLFTVRHCVQNM
ncbi:DNA replication licensing factor, mcm4 component [Blomia tropicalis]|nr:DNA replication licensing factor, mcm4 component [Blomia tropicalis]